MSVTTHPHAFSVVSRCAIVVSGLVAASRAQVAGASGEQVYPTRCASCHDQASPRIPPREALQKMMEWCSSLRLLALRRHAWERVARVRGRRQMKGSVFRSRS